MLDVMVEALAASEERDLLVLAYTLASLVFTSKADTKMVKRRFAMLGDILRDTWAYQEIMEEGREEGFQKGREEGLKESLQALRHILLNITQTSFPELKSLARRKAALITEPKVLEDVTLKLLAARTSEEARQILNDIATKVE